MGNASALCMPYLSLFREKGATVTVVLIPSLAKALTSFLPSCTLASSPSDSDVMYLSRSRRARSSARFCVGVGDNAVSLMTS